METTYYNPRLTGSFGGINALRRQVNIPIQSLKQWLSAQDSYTLHKPIRKRFLRRRVYAKGIDDIFQADLVDLSHLSRSNRGFRFVITAVDVFSKVAFAVGLKDKRGVSVANAFEKIFSVRIPTRVNFDYGTEFYNSNVLGLFKKYNIQHYSTMNYDIKGSVIERFNRTLKTRMFKYFTYKQTNNWIDVLDDLIASYNDSYHRSIGMTPNNVSFENEATVRRRLYPMLSNEVKYSFEIDDKVRVCKYKNIFTKSYLQGWSQEIFKVSERKPTNPPTYCLKDLDGESIKGTYYKEELQKVIKEDEIYNVEKIIKKRKRAGRTEYYVKWFGYPSKFNSWVTDVFKRSG